MDIRFHEPSVMQIWKKKKKDKIQIVENLLISVENLHISVQIRVCFCFDSNESCLVAKTSFTHVKWKNDTVVLGKKMWSPKPPYKTMITNGHLNIFVLKCNRVYAHFFFYCIYLRYIIWWFDICIYYEITTTIKLLNMSITSHSYLCVCGGRTVRGAQLLGNFQVHSTGPLPTATLLCISRTHSLCINWNCVPLDQQLPISPYN